MRVKRVATSDFVLLKYRQLFFWHIVVKKFDRKCGETVTAKSISNLEATRAWCRMFHHAVIQCHINVEADVRFTGGNFNDLIQPSFARLWQKLRPWVLQSYVKPDWIFEKLHDSFLLHKTLQKS